MKKNIRTSLSGLLFVALLAFCCTNCGDDKDKAFTLNVRMEAPATVFNPILPSAGYSRFVSMRIFQSLAEVDPESFELKPILLQSIPTERNVEDGPHKGEIAYDFELNPAAKWDNGTPITSADIIFSLKLIFHPGLPTQIWQDYFKTVSGIETDAANNRKFTVYLKEYYMLGLESLCQFPIYPAYHYDPQSKLANVPLSDFLDNTKKDALSQNADLQAFATNFTDPKYKTDPAFILGSGAYLLESTNGEEGVTLRRKKDWWGDSDQNNSTLLKAYPDRIVYKTVKAEPTIENMLRKDELDIAVDVSPTYFRKMESDPELKAKYDFIQIWASRYSRLIFNLKNPNKPELADINVRKAIAQAIDFDEVKNNIYLGMAQRSITPVNPKKSYYARDIQALPFSIEAAKKTLADAGWTDTNNDGTVDKVINGQRRELVLDMLTTLEIEVNKMISNMIAQNAGKAGIKINLNSKNIQEIAKLTREGNFDLALTANAVNPGYPELSQNYAGSNTPDKGGDNRGGFQNAEFDELLAKIRSTRDTKLREQYYLEAQRVFYRELPEVVLFSSDYRIIVSKKFKPVLSSSRPGYYEHLFQLK